MNWKTRKTIHKLSASSLDIASPEVITSFPSERYLNFSYFKFYSKMTSHEPNTAHAADHLTALYSIKNFLGLCYLFACISNVVTSYSQQTKMYSELFATPMLLDFSLRLILKSSEKYWNQKKFRSNVIRMSSKNLYNIPCRHWNIYFSLLKNIWQEYLLKNVTKCKQKCTVKPSGQHIKVKYRKLVKSHEIRLQAIIIAIIIQLWTIQCTTQQPTMHSIVFNLKSNWILLNREIGQISIGIWMCSIGTA